MSGIIAMGDVVELKPAGLENDLEFVSDLPRFAKICTGRTESHTEKVQACQEELGERKLADDDAIGKSRRTPTRIRDGSSRAAAELLGPHVPDRSWTTTASRLATVLIRVR